MCIVIIINSGPCLGGHLRGTDTLGYVSLLITSRGCTYGIVEHAFANDGLMVRLMR